MPFFFFVDFFAFLAVFFLVFFAFFLGAFFLVVFFFFFVAFFFLVGPFFLLGAKVRGGGVRVARRERRKARFKG